jgi:putative endonuclease
MKAWFVYMLRCADDSLYTGITTDVVRRINEHNGYSKTGGAKYTRARQPVELVYVEQADSRSDATSREIEIKNLTRSDKLKLIKKPAESS